MFFLRNRCSSARATSWTTPSFSAASRSNAAPSFIHTCGSVPTWDLDLCHFLTPSFEFGETPSFAPKGLLCGISKTHALDQGENFTQSLFFQDWTLSFESARCTGARDALQDLAKVPFVLKLGVWCQDCVFFSRLGEKVAMCCDTSLSLSLSRRHDLRPALFRNKRALSRNASAERRPRAPGPFGGHETERERERERSRFAKRTFSVKKTFPNIKARSRV